MKISNKLIEETVCEVVGGEVLPIIKTIKNKKNVSEFKISESVELEINVVRNMLYKLYHANLVSFVRKKDKKKGWYIYYWTFNPKRIKFLAEDLKERRLKKLRERLKREEEKFFFQCESKCMRLEFDQASDFSFKCPECGKLLNQEDNRGKIKELKAEIKRLSAK